MTWEASARRLFEVLGREPVEPAYPQGTYSP
jgi:hypothetical protein